MGADGIGWAKASSWEFHGMFIGGLSEGYRRAGVNEAPTLYPSHSRSFVWKIGSRSRPL